jgi:hypothetical protein
VTAFTSLRSVQMKKEGGWPIAIFGSGDCPVRPPNMAPLWNVPKLRVYCHQKPQSPSFGRGLSVTIGRRNIFDRFLVPGKDHI